MVHVYYVDSYYDKDGTGKSKGMVYDKGVGYMQILLLFSILWWTPGAAFCGWGGGSIFMDTDVCTKNKHTPTDSNRRAGQHAKYVKPHTKCNVLL